MKKLKNVFWVSAGLLFIEYCMTKLGINDAFPWINNILLTALGFFIVLYCKYNGVIQEIETVIICFGYISRLCLMLISLYASDVIALPYHHIGDDDRFYEESVTLLSNPDYHPISYYCFFLAAVFTILGVNRMVAMLINIICYLLSCLILLKLAKSCRIKPYIIQFGLGVFSFMPVYMLLSSSLMRESIIILFIAVSNYFMILWIREGEWKYIIYSLGALIPPTVLHSGTIVLAPVVAIFVSVYDVQKQKICIKKKFFVGIVLTVAVLLICFITPIRPYIAAYLPTDMENLMKIVDAHNAQEAGANYLDGIDPRGFGDLIRYLPVKMLYFQFSPLPGDWRGLFDAGAFFIDACFYMLSMLLIIYEWLKNHDKICFFILLEILSFQIMFAWGVMNAGSAMRHRSKLLAVIVFGTMYAVNQIYNRKSMQNKADL